MILWQFISPTTPTSHSGSVYTVLVIDKKQNFAICGVYSAYGTGDRWM